MRLTSPLVRRKGAGQRWRREVLQVDDQRIGAAGEHGLVRGGIGAGAEQPGAAQVGVGAGHAP
jgi:hypothetical protein